jgi:hypothetical protein
VARPARLTPAAQIPESDGHTSTARTPGSSSAPAPRVGTLRLDPRTLIARPGRNARWRLARTPPLAWKRLDWVALRLEQRGKPVGRIVLDQKTRRPRARGPAVRLVAGRSTVVSGQSGGKRLTAKLTLLIAKRYAGRTLVAKLAARDDNGARQHFVGRTDQRAAPFASEQERRSRPGLSVSGVTP